jgi:hypothetical protein
VSLQDACLFALIPATAWLANIHGRFATQTMCASLIISCSRRSGDRRSEFRRGLRSGSKMAPTDVGGYALRGTLCRLDCIRLSGSFKNSQQALAQSGLIAGGQLFVAFDAAMNDALQGVVPLAARGVNEFERERGCLLGAVMQDVRERAENEGVDIGWLEMMSFAVGVHHAEEERAADLSLGFGCPGEFDVAQPKEIVAAGCELLAVFEKLDGSGNHRQL